MIANGKERRARIQVLRREVKRVEGTALDMTREYLHQLKVELWALVEVERIARGTWGKA